VNQGARDISITAASFAIISSRATGMNTAPIAIGGNDHRGGPRRAFGDRHENRQLVETLRPET
jgi:hypothetical protein